MADCKPSGKFTNKAFEKYGDWRNLTKLVQAVSGGRFTGVQEMNAAVKKGDIAGIPDQLVGDFVYGNVENGLRAQGFDDAAIAKIVDDTVQMMRSGKFKETPSELPPSSPLTDHAGGVPTITPTEAQGAGGISGVGNVGDHGAAGIGEWRDPEGGGDWSYTVGKGFSDIEPGPVHGTVLPNGRPAIVDTTVSKPKLALESGDVSSGSKVDVSLPDDSPFLQTKWYPKGPVTGVVQKVFANGNVSVAIDQLRNMSSDGRRTLLVPASAVRALKSGTMLGGEVAPAIPMQETAAATRLKVAREDFLNALKRGESAAKAFTEDEVGALDLSKIADMFKVKPGENRLFSTRAMAEAGYDISFKAMFKDFNDAERMLTASGDDSFVLNQGFLSLFAHPTALGPAFIDSMKGLVKGNSALRATNAKLNSLPSHNLARRVGLRFDNLGDSEFFTGSGPFSGALKNAPVLGGFIEHGDAAYSAAGNVLRGRIFDTYANSWGLMKSLGQQGGTLGSPEYARAWKDAQDLRDWTHAITGIGDVSALPALMQDIGPLFFAYKFMASKVNILLGPLQYTQQAMRGTLGRVLPSRIGVGTLSEFGMPMPLVLSAEHASSWRMAALAWRDLGLYMTGVGLTAFALKQAGFDVETDANSNDFMKVKIGSTVWDLSGGMGRPFALLYQTFISHKHKAGGSQGTYSLDNPDVIPFGAQNLQDLWVNYLVGRLAPGYSQGLQIIRGQNFQGKPPTPWDIFPLPITAKQAIEGLLFDGVDAKDIGLIPTFFGAHGYERGPAQQPPGPLGQPIKDLFGGKKAGGAGTPSGGTVRP